MLVFCLCRCVLQLNMAQIMRRTCHQMCQLNPWFVNIEICRAPVSNVGVPPSTFHPAPTGSWHKLSDPKVMKKIRKTHRWNLKLEPSPSPRKDAVMTDSETKCWPQFQSHLAGCWKFWWRQQMTNHFGKYRNITKHPINLPVSTMMRWRL